jgi:nucleoside-triphosphate--adenylate kinase
LRSFISFFGHRWIHPGSGRIYSYSYKAPKVHGLDDITGEPLVQRPDDQPASVRTRLEAYDAVRLVIVAGGSFGGNAINLMGNTFLACLFLVNQVTAPLVDYYAANGVLESFHGTMSDVIYPQVKEWLGRKL